MSEFTPAENVLAVVEAVTSHKEKFQTSLCHVSDGGRSRVLPRPTMLQVLRMAFALEAKMVVM